MSWSASVNSSHLPNIVHVGGSTTDEAARRCKLKFNPGNTLATAIIKSFCTAAMQSVINERDKVPKPAEDSPDHAREGYADTMRCYATALTHLETASMFAIAGVHARANAKP